MVKKIIFIFVILIITLTLAYFAASLALKPVLLKQLNKAVNRRVEVKVVSLSFPLNLKFEEVRIFNKGGSGNDLLLSAEDVRIGVNPFSLFGPRVLLSHIILTKPELKIEKNSEGDLNVDDFLAPAQEPKAKKAKTLLILKAEIKKGQIQFLDKTVLPQPLTSKIDHLNLRLAKVSFPPTTAKTNFRLSFDLINLANQIKGTFHTQGWINMVKKDMLADLEIKNFDLIYFKPYYKSGFSYLESGVLDFSSDLDSKDNNLMAICRLEARYLSFGEPSQAASKLLDVSVRDLVEYLKDSQGKIVMNFTLRGKMDKPQELISQAADVVIKSTLQKLVYSQLERFLEFGHKAANGAGTATDKTKEKLEDIRKVLEGIFKTE